MQLVLIDLRTAEALKVQNGSLHTLCLIGNTFEVDEAEVIVAAFEQSTSLQSLGGFVPDLRDWDFECHSSLTPFDVVLVYRE